jgi:enamine deaminase RidA (YjgF/YER057c/UK114 family)
MQHRILFASVAAVASIVLTVAGSAAQRHKNQEPKTQVLPLPPELPKALLADTATLDFHISPLLRTGGLSAQIRQSLNDLIRDTHGETIIKLRAFVAGAGDARRVQAEAANLFTDRKLPLPALTVLQVGALGQETAQVVIEAVVSTHRTVNPSGLAFFAGQNGASFDEALRQLRESVAAAGVAPDHVLTSTCFTSQIGGYDTARSAVQSAFPNTAINIVQAVRDPPNDAGMCEAVGQLAQPPAAGGVVLLKKSRATLVNTQQLIFTGLQLSFGSFLDDAHEAFVRLQRTASSLQPVAAPVEVNAFSLDAYASSALRKMTSFPPSAFTAQTVEGLPAIDASGGIEAILAPGVPEPQSVSR